MAKKAAPPVAHNMIGGGIQMSSTGEKTHGTKKHVRSIRTKRAKGGGHVVSHEFDNSGGSGYHQDEEHVFGKDEGVKHVKHYIRNAGISGVSVSGADASADDGGKDDTA